MLLRETRDKVRGYVPIDLRSCQGAATERVSYVQLNTKSKEIL